MQTKCFCLQVLALAVIHFFLSVGNILTTFRVLRQKLTAEVSNLWRQKYKFRNHARDQGHEGEEEKNEEEVVGEGGEGKKEQ
jgi:hypothetical protein